MPAFRLEEWFVQPSLNRMTLGEMIVPLEPRLIHVLACLASRPEIVVSREDLLEIVWGDVVVGDDTLTVTISELRRIFGDDAKSPRFIETIRKGGYRLVAPVSILADSEKTSPDPKPEEDQNAAESSGLRRQLRSRQLALVLGPPAVFLVLILSVWLFLNRADQPAQPDFLAFTPFTSYQGNEITPALSPDGTRVAFVWWGEDGDNADIYIKQQNTESPLRLTDHPGREHFPAWSPDGSTIAFVRLGEEAGIFTVPVIGGPVTRLAHLGPDVNGLDWSPDGKWLVFADASRVEDPYQIALLSLSSLEVHHIDQPSTRYSCNSAPVFSPDGETIAFMRAGLGLYRDICLLPVNGGEVRKIAPSQRNVAGLDWSPDGQDIIFSAAPAGVHSLWRVSVEDEKLSWLPTPGHAVLHPTLSMSGNRLVYEKLIFDNNIWTAPLSLGADTPGMTVPLISSTFEDSQADISPDGNLIAFKSMRSGNMEIWICNRFGREARQVTNFSGEYVLDPQWSPDGKRLVFTASQAGYLVIYVVDADGGIARSLATDPHHQMSPLWSSTGDWIYFSREDEDTWQIWKIAGDGQNLQLVTSRGLEALYETGDGQHLFFTGHDNQSIWRKSLVDGQEDCQVSSGQASQWSDLVVTEEGIYHIHRTRTRNVFSLLSFSTCEVDSLFPLDISGEVNLAVSPDRTYILFDRVDQLERDLMLVEDFQ